MKKTFEAVPAFALICAVAAATTGCLSDEEIEQRRKWAFDLAGEYDEVRGEGVAAGALLVENQRDKNDVKLTFTRGTLYDGEQAFVDLLLNDADKAAVAAAVTFGEGDDDFVEGFTGGENVSKDFGKSSSVGVAAAAFGAKPGVEGAEESKLRWTLSLGIENGSDELKGRLEVEFSEMRPKASDPAEKELHVEREGFDVLFRRAAGPIESDVCVDCYEDDGAPMEDEPAAEGAGDDAQTGDGATDDGAGDGPADDGA